MNSTFKLIVLILLMSNTFFTFFIAYDIYGNNLISQESEVSKNATELASNKRKISTLYYTNFIDSYNFTLSQVSNIKADNILHTNTELLLNVSYNCSSLDGTSFDSCNALFKDMKAKKVTFVNTIKNITSSYEVQLGAIALKSTTIEDSAKETMELIKETMVEKNFKKAQANYAQSLKKIKEFLEVEYSKSISN